MGEAEDETDSQADKAWAAGLDVLLDLATTVIEDAHEIAVAAVSGRQDGQFARAEALQQAGADLGLIARVCEVFIRRQHDR